jgi:hypothetical protein
MWNSSKESENEFSISMSKSEGKIKLDVKIFNLDRVISIIIISIENITHFGRVKVIIIRTIADANLNESIV